MSLVTTDPPLAEPRPTVPKSATATMKLPRVLRRGSTIDSTENQKEKDTRRPSIQETERRSSRSTIPLRLRRRKTQPTIERTEAGEVKAAAKSGYLLLSLPSEILNQIITHLPLPDILTLRLTSHAFISILNYNAAQLSHRLLDDTLPTDTPHSLLFPFPTHNHPNLLHLLTTLKRHEINTTQTNTLLSFVQMKIYMTRTATRILSINLNRQRLLEAFHPPAWILTHFLESLRNITIHAHLTHPQRQSKITACSSCIQLAKEQVSKYPDHVIMPTHHYFQLTLQHLLIATRVPAAAGPLERKLRGWGKGPVTGESLAIFVLLGGMPEIRKVAMMQGSYGSRLAFVMEFVGRVRDAVTVNGILREEEERRRRESGVTVGNVLTVTDRDHDDGNNNSNTTNSSSSGGGSSNSNSKIDVTESLAPPYHILTQEHIDSLPAVDTFFYDFWKDRIAACAVDEEDIAEPYPWLQRVIAGSGVEFSQPRSLDPSLALGASPV